MIDTKDPFGDPDDPTGEGSGLPPVVTAAFHGQCAAECGVGIEEGDDIRADGAGGWTHADCEEWVAL